MWLRWQRERAGVCLREAARRLGTSAAYLSDVERGARNVTQRVEEFYVERFAA
jgi:transcriptional regulator with XRE-family HTH domain